MIPAHKAFILLGNTVIMCSLTAALITTNSHKLESEYLVLSILAGVLGNTVLAVANLENAIDNE